MESGYYAIVIKSSVLTKSGKEVVEKIPLESPDVDIKKLYEWTNCDLIDIVPCSSETMPTKSDHYRYLMIVDDNGKLKGSRVNVTASLLYGADPYIDFIVGDVVILCDIKPYEWSDPDAYGMPEVIADDAMRIIRYWQRH